MRVDEFVAEQNLRHADGICCVARRFRRALAGLVAMAKVGVLNVEVPLARRNVHRLAGTAAHEMNGWRGVGELDEIGQIFEGGIASTAIEIGDEGWSADRREHRGVAAHLHRLGGVAGMHLKNLWGAFEQFAAEAAGQAHELAPHIGARFAPELQGRRITTELDADFLQDRLGVVLDDLDGLGVQQIDHRNFPLDVGELRQALLTTLGPAGVPTAPRNQTTLRHAASLRPSTQNNRQGRVASTVCESSRRKRSS